MIRPVSETGATAGFTALSPEPRQSLIFPGVCTVCRSHLSPDFDSVCSLCRKELQLLPEPRCPGCGGVIDGALDLCAECIQSGGRSWDHAVSVFSFSNLPRELVHRYKYQGDTALARVLGKYMLESWRKSGNGRQVDLITPIPLHWLRTLSRGYNQAGLLAEKLAAALDVPWQNLLCRRHYTKKQTTLNRDRRQKNMHQVFVAKRQEKIKGCSILLVDDVMTTGATLNAAATVLRRAGAANVYVITLARG